MMTGVLSITQFVTVPFSTKGLMLNSTAQ